MKWRIVALVAAGAALVAVFGWLPDEVSASPGPPPAAHRSAVLGTLTMAENVSPNTLSVRRPGWVRSITLEVTAGAALRLELDGRRTGRHYLQLVAPASSDGFFMLLAGTYSSPPIDKRDTQLTLSAQVTAMDSLTVVVIGRS